MNDAAPPYSVREDGSFAVRAFELPISQYFDARAQDVYRCHVRRIAEIMQGIQGHWADPQAVNAMRAYFAEHFLPTVEAWRARCAVRIEPETIADVRTEIFTPAAGVSAANRERVLINLHGGGFMVAAEYGGRLESIPVAAWGKVKVISVDYRMAPEHRFPAATDDVLAVYQELLKSYQAGSIGIFGCSAGAVLTAQTVARLAHEGLPLPGAVGMFSGAGGYWNEGDTGHLGHAMTGIELSSPLAHPYFVHVDREDALVFPLRSPAALAKFPPSLLMSATRDYALSSVVHMHSRLAAAGVEAQLHVWEGLDHAFFYNPDFPQSREAHEVAIRFFDRHLGRAG